MGLRFGHVQKMRLLFHLGPCLVWGLPASLHHPLYLGRWLAMLPCLERMEKRLRQMSPGTEWLKILVLQTNVIYCRGKLVKVGQKGLKIVDQVLQ